MKRFAQYLAESEQTYSYRIKIVGDLYPGFEKEFRKRLEKFQPVRIADTKKTPVLSRPADFDQHANQSVNMFDAEFRYPAAPQQIEQMAELLGIDVNRVRINDLEWSETMDRELMGIDDQASPVLDNDYPDNSAEQQQAIQDYAAIGADKDVVKNSASEAAWTVAGGATPAAVTTNQLEMGTKSPMSNIKRPAKPEVGRQTKD